MLLGYNTNGLAHHDPFEAVALLAEIGYKSVAITLDHGRLNPFADGFRTEVDHMRDLLERLEMSSVVETGARFLLDPRRKHEPTLMSPTAHERSRRTEFLCRAVEVARRLDSHCVSLWSGALREPIGDDEAFERLAQGLQRVLDEAESQQVVIGFEPEPGMFIDTMDRFAELYERIESPMFGLTLDVGHLHCLGEAPIADMIRRWSKPLANVHIEDMRAGVHEHLMFGEGEIDFPPIFQALLEARYEAGVYVELSRHSHEGPDAARRAYEFLSPLIPEQP